MTTNRVLGLHHLGINVADAESARDQLVGAGFEAGDLFRIDNEGSAVGNGLRSIDMQVCFLRLGATTVEVIAHAAPASEAVAVAPAAGTTSWSVPRAGADAQVLDLPGVRASVGPTDSVELSWWTSDPEATGELLVALGLQRADDGWGFPGGRLRVAAADPGTAPPSVTAVGRTHLSFRYADAQAVHDDLVDRGFECVSAPVSHEDVIFWFFVHAPGGGGSLEVIQDNDRILG